MTVTFIVINFATVFEHPALQPVLCSKQLMLSFICNKVSA